MTKHVGANGIDNQCVRGSILLLIPHHEFVFAQDGLEAHPAGKVGVDTGVSNLLQARHGIRVWVADLAQSASGGEKVDWLGLVTFVSVQ